MKKYLFLLFLLIISSFLLLSHNKPRNFTITDCIEDGVCKTGLKVFIDNKEVTITQDYCLSHNKHWDEKNMTCWIR